MAPPSLLYASARQSLTARKGNIHHEHGGSIVFLTKIANTESKSSHRFKWRDAANGSIVPSAYDAEAAPHEYNLKMLNIVK
ncbi:MAG: hypothetical protein FWF41_08120 [Betaproteobacteria bacterium]|nr:hypothetical protein [Betaproteobacteria bacterium]